MSLDAVDVFGVDSRPLDGTQWGPNLLEEFEEMELGSSLEERLVVPTDAIVLDGQSFAIWLQEEIAIEIDSERCIQFRREIAVELPLDISSI
ncbi:hypothetical protein [Natrinema longum]|uniref:hypothetical protein n=1 Tax=Natrinema longum TaxID=370324 RepID=UPI001CCAA278|nr:hypothetical protein [Natrinema longum]MBZ6497097.1 hypothetical protein [Natrinema longum]